MSDSHKFKFQWSFRGNELKAHVEALGLKFENTSDGEIIIDRSSFGSGEHSLAYASEAVILAERAVRIAVERTLASARGCHDCEGTGSMYGSINPSVHKSDPRQSCKTCRGKGVVFEERK